MSAFSSGYQCNVGLIYAAQHIIDNTFVQWIWTKLDQNENEEQRVLCKGTSKTLPSKLRRAKTYKRFRKWVESVLSLRKAVKYHLPERKDLRLLTKSCLISRFTAFLWIFWHVIGRIYGYLMHCAMSLSTHSAEHLVRICEENRFTHMILVSAFSQETCRYGQSMTERK